MSHALTAIVLISLAERPNQFVPVADMAERTSLPLPAVTGHLERMEAQGQVQLCRGADGAPVSATANNHDERTTP